MTVLFVGAHPDDVESGCGGTMARYCDVSSVSVSTLCGKNSGLEFTDAEIEQELYRSLEVLGLKGTTYIHNYENTRLPEYAENIRHDLEDIKKDISPDRVFIPSLNSIHQDHLTVAMEALKAFRGRESIYSYEVLSEKCFIPNVYIDVSSTIDKKVEALKCYKTQSTRANMSGDIWTSLARVHGAKSSVKYAEAFELIREFE